MFNINLSGPCSLGMDSNNWFDDTIVGLGSLFAFDCCDGVGGFAFFCCFFFVPDEFGLANNGRANR